MKAGQKQRYSPISNVMPALAEMLYGFTFLTA